ncbi:MAG: hypothetical protein Q9207_004148 [Kuettlingeria erythrocarpa]
MDPLDCDTVAPALRTLCVAHPSNFKAVLTARFNSYNNGSKTQLNLSIALPLLMTTALCFGIFVYWLFRRRHRYKPFRPEIEDDPTTRLLSLDRFKRRRKPRILRDAQGEIVFTGCGSTAPETLDLASIRTRKGDAKKKDALEDSYTGAQLWAFCNECIARASIDTSINMSQQSTPENYDFLRRQSSRMTNPMRSQSSSRSPRRKPTRQQSMRDSQGTASTVTSNSTGGLSAATNLTQPPSYSKKFVVVGDGGCGKTCLLISYSQGYFPEKYVPTVFENYITHTTHQPTGKTVELALWDTAGQEEYDRLRPLSYPETDLIFVCFAIDCPNSLENVMDKWYPEVLHFCPTTPLILVGLKSDLRSNRVCIDLLKTQGLTPVTPEQGQRVARQMGAIYIECSSKESKGVEDVFELAVNTAVGQEIELKQQRELRQDHGGRTTTAAKRSKRRGCPIL